MTVHACTAALSLPRAAKPAHRHGVCPAPGEYRAGTVRVPGGQREGGSYQVRSYPVLHWESAVYRHYASLSHSVSRVESVQNPVLCGHVCLTC